MVFCPLIWAQRQDCPFFRQCHRVQSGTFWHRHQQQDKCYRNRNWYRCQDLSRAKIWYQKIVEKNISSNRRYRRVVNSEYLNFGALKNSEYQKIRRLWPSKIPSITHQMALKSEFCTCECSCTAVIWCCHATCNNGISLVFKSIGQQEFKFSNFVASQCCTSVVIPFDEKFNIWICFIESLKIPWFDIGNTRHQLF